MTTESQTTRTEYVEITRVEEPPRVPMTAERVRELFEDAQYEPSSYSGRAMYGARCLSVTTDSASGAATVILDVVQSCAENGTAEDVLELVSILRGSRVDSMGRGTVVYWPSIGMADEDPYEEEYGGRGDREDFHSDG